MRLLAVILCSLSLMVDLASTQSTESFNLLSSLLSDAGSIFTFVTSALGPTEASTTSLPTSTTSDSSATQTSAPTTSSTSSSTASSTSSTSGSSAAITSTPTSSGVASSTGSAAAQSSSATNANSDHNNGGSDTLAIVLGCTLGALALAAFIALLYLCLRRRKRSRAAAKRRSSLSTADAEDETWRHEKPRVRSFKGPQYNAVSETAHDSGPLATRNHDMASNDAYRNPFVPAPPPARRSSRHDLEPMPYSPDDVRSQHLHGEQALQRPDNHHGNALAYGLGGAALGGLAAHARQRHERNRSASRDKVETTKGVSETETNTLPQTAGNEYENVRSANAKEPWPYGALAATRRSTDSARSRHNSFGRSQEHFFTPNQHPWDNEAMPKDAGILAGAGAYAAIAANSRVQNRYSYDREGLPATQVADGTNNPNTTGSVSPPIAHNSGPHELATTDLPNTPLVRGRPTSAFGSAAPAAAIGAISSQRSQSREKSTSPQARRRSSSWSQKEPSFQPKDAAQSSLTRDPESHMPTGGWASDTKNIDKGGAGMNRLSSSEQHAPPFLAVSPPLESQRNDASGLVSPVSPINNSNPGTWSKLHAEELGLLQPTSQRMPSQESTAVDSISSPSKGSSDASDQSSSGLVSAIQRVFNSQKTNWQNQDAADGTGTSYRPLHHDAPSAVPPYRNVPRRKPVVVDTNPIDVSSVSHSTSVVDTFPSDRRSGESARSLPPRYHSRGEGSRDAVNTADFAPSTSAPSTPRPRAPSRPGYGIGSGDPFDLARIRTDSSMTGVSLSHYQEPHRPRSANMRISSGSQDYREPTLAELRHQVQAEDRERARKSWDRAHRRSGSSGLRYGDDRELFNLVDQTTGWADHHKEPRRFYAKQKRGSSEVGRAI